MFLSLHLSDRKICSLSGFHFQVFPSMTFHFYKQAWISLHLKNKDKGVGEAHTLLATWNWPHFLTKVLWFLSGTRYGADFLGLTQGLATYWWPWANDATSLYTSRVSWSHLTALLWGLKCSDQCWEHGRCTMLVSWCSPISGAPHSLEPRNSHTLATWSSTTTIGWDHWYLSMIFWLLKLMLVFGSTLCSLHTAN